MSYKRIIVLSDGTGQTLENKIPTNILKLSLAITREDDAGVQQIMQYDAGLGTEGNAMDNFLGNAFGEGIDQNIMQLYSFLAFNYDKGDEIYLFGFSRGAYTVRSLAGLIHHAGLVRRDQAQYIKEAYELYRKKLPRNSEEPVAFRAVHGDTVPIKLLACFDTVGALGPQGFMSFFNHNRYKFHSTTLTANIEHAIHILSIDEDRKPFAPTLMTEDPDRKGQLTQLYFWGGHSGVGGGSQDESEAPKCTIKFLLDEMERRRIALKINRDNIKTDFDINAPVGSTMGASGAAMKFFMGSFTRQVGSVDEMHPSAVQRFLLKDEWRPESLKHLEQEILRR